MTPNIRLLIIEDNPAIVQNMTDFLESKGYLLDFAMDGIGGLHLALTQGYDVIVLDLMLPGMDGLTVIETVRKQGIGTPVLILSAKRSVDDRIRGLQQGGDDYMIKPFSFAELLARIQALIRRDSRIMDSHILCAGDLTMDLLSRKVIRQGRQIDLEIV